MSQLLNYLVEAAIANPKNPPKAYQVAVDGLGRSEDFDVQADSYPRVQVGRLRKMLAAHYAARGCKERLRIPIGHYAVEMQLDIDEIKAKQDGPTGRDGGLSKAAPPSPPINRWFNNRQTTIGLAGFLLVIGLVLTSIWNTGKADLSGTAALSQDYSSPPIIYFASSPEGSPDADRSQIAGIDQFLENAFARSSQVRLAAAELSGTAPETEQNAYRFKSRSTTGANGPEIIFSLTSLARNETIWSATISMPDTAADYPDRLGPIASRVAGTYGVIATDQRKYLPEDAMTGYACLLRFESYRANRDPELLPVVDSCIKGSLAADPLDSQVLAAASFMAYLRTEETGRKPDPVAGLKFAREAMVRGREDASANFALARASFFNGSCALGKEFTEKASELDPYEASIQAQAGAFLFACGDPSAIKYLRRAIALDPRGSIVAETALVFTLLAEGKDKEALEFAEKIVPSSTGVGPYYDIAMAMVYAKNGRIEQSRVAWERLVAAYGSKEAEKPEGLLNRLILNPVLANRAFLLLSVTGVITK